MEQQVRQPTTSEEAMLMVSATDQCCHGFFSTDRSERYTGRLVGVGVVVITFGALALGLVYASRTQPAGAVRTDMLQATPPPTLRLSPQRPRPALQPGRRTPHVQLALALTENRTQLYPIVGYYLQK